MILFVRYYRSHFGGTRFRLSMKNRRLQRLQKSNHWIDDDVFNGRMGTPLMVAPKYAEELIVQ